MASNDFFELIGVVEGRLYQLLCIEAALLWGDSLELQLIVIDYPLIASFLGQLIVLDNIVFKFLQAIEIEYFQSVLHK